MYLETASTNHGTGERTADDRLAAALARTAQLLSAIEGGARLKDIRAAYRAGERGQRLVASAQRAAAERREARRRALLAKETARFVRRLDARGLEAAARGQIVETAHGRAWLTGRAVVAEVLRRVGPAGEQALADEARYTEEFERPADGGKKGGICGGDYREVSAVWLAPDSSAAIIAYAEWGSWGVSGARARNGVGRGGLHHFRIRAYLVVRDTTTGERHMIRVPPRFGSKNVTLRGLGYRRDDAWRPGGDLTALATCNLRIRDAEGLRVYDHAANERADLARHWLSNVRRIHAAVAWTFGLRPSAYRPQIEA